MIDYVYSNASDIGVSSLSQRLHRQWDADVALLRRIAWCDRYMLSDLSSLRNVGRCEGLTGLCYCQARLSRYGIGVSATTCELLPTSVKMA